ncbi:uracil-DNA glycosylase [Haloarchaeobius litoreus]|uniref:Uracil-DNA glycosylase family protein n=1 Tax=Haloarchaeobius litoreus TaxID=755306 RepID=A0ABD6DG81_9EURY
MDANQDDLANPFGMDEDCTNCELCERRERVVHGYGDVGADFLFVGEGPDAAAEAAGVPFGRDEGFGRVLQRLGLRRVDDDPDEPAVANVFLTSLTRCHHPDRPATDAEVGTCEPYLNAEIRMINPEIIVPVGERALAEISAEYTTTPATELDMYEQHGEAIRGRGFELVPMIPPRAATDEQVQTFVERFAALMASDYRQTKGRRER